MHVQLSPNLLPRLLFKVAQYTCVTFFMAEPPQYPGTGIKIPLFPELGSKVQAYKPGKFTFYLSAK